MPSSSLTHAIATLTCVYVSCTLSFWVGALYGGVCICYSLEQIYENDSTYLFIYFCIKMNVCMSDSGSCHHWLVWRLCEEKEANKKTRKTIHICICTHLSILFYEWTVKVSFVTFLFWPPLKLMLLHNIMYTSIHRTWLFFFLYFHSNGIYMTPAKKIHFINKKKSNNWQSKLKCQNRYYKIVNRTNTKHHFTKY